MNEDLKKQNEKIDKEMSEFKRYKEEHDPDLRIDASDVPLSEKTQKKLDHRYKGDITKDMTVINRLKLGDEPITQDMKGFTHDSYEKQEDLNNLRTGVNTLMTELGLIYHTKKPITMDLFCSIFEADYDERTEYGNKPYTMDLTLDAISMKEKWEMWKKILSLMEEAYKLSKKSGNGQADTIFHDAYKQARMYLLPVIKRLDPNRLKMDLDKTIDKVEKTKKPNGDEEEEDEESEEEETDEEKKAKEKELIDDLISTREFYIKDGKVIEKWATGDMFELSYGKELIEHLKNREND